MPFFIWPYPPEQELEVVGEYIVDRLRTTRWSERPRGGSLFELAVELLEAGGAVGGKMLERLEQIEPTCSRSAFRRDLQRMLDPSGTSSPLLSVVSRRGYVDPARADRNGRVFPIRLTTF